METFDNNHSEDNITEEFEPKTNTQPSAPENQPKHRSGLRKAVSAVLALALVAGSCGLTYAAVNNKWEDKMQKATSSISSMQQQLNALRSSGSVSATNVTYAVSPEGAQTPRMVYENNAKSVVAVSSTVQTNYYGQTRQGTSTGSGFILSEDGYVVTNYHVIEGATAITVTMDGGTEYNAKLIGSDATNDVALLKVEATGLPAVKLGSSDDLAIGDMVCAIGNPLGSLTATLTVGYVSGKDRQVTTDNATINMIQTDAAINSGNSGGALFNSYGEVVGITNAKYSSSSSSGSASIDNIGFAIPINHVKNIITSIIEKGYIVKPYIGVSVTTVSSEMVSYGLPQGAAVKAVSESSPAAECGLKINDIITAINGKEITTSSELVKIVSASQPGDEMTLTIYRQGESEQLTLTLTVGEQQKSALADPTSSSNQQQSSGSYGGFPFGFGYGYGG